MVRSVRKCLGCCQRFIAFAAQQYCLSCKGADNGKLLESNDSCSKIDKGKSVLRDHQSSLKRVAGTNDDAPCDNGKKKKLDHSTPPKLSSSSSSDPSIEQRKVFSSSSYPSMAEPAIQSSTTKAIRKDDIGNVLIALDEDEDSHSEGSEAGDDLNCTQIVQDTDEEDENIDEDDRCHILSDTRSQGIDGNDNVDEQHHVNNSSSISTCVVNVTSAISRDPNANGDNEDICFICGASLAGLKRRVDHIKRCSKKHGISCRDVKVNDDFEEFAMDDTSIPNRQKENINNPYSINNGQWHGDASLALRLATQTGINHKEESTSIIPSTLHKKQPTIQSFLTAPIRSVNSVLVSGARRMSKMTKIAAARKDAANSASNSNQGRLFGRGSKRGGFYNKKSVSIKIFWR